MTMLLNPETSAPDRLRESLPGMRWYFVFFILSGFCGLFYEVIWMRLAMASFGVTTALASIVISMFMAGLGFGSWVTGKICRRHATRNGSTFLRLYSLAELLIGVSSIAVPYQLRLGRLLLQHARTFSAWQSSSYYVLAGVWIAITLIPWCTCMGATFPLLMAVIRKTARPASERSFSYLYIANVLGALLGTLTSALILIELLGFQKSLFVAGGLNAVLAILAFRLSNRVDSQHAAEMSAPARPLQPKLYGLPGKSILAFLFLSGLVSMGLEVVWIRQFTPFLGNVVYAFAAILAVYLFATVVGSQDYHSHFQESNPDKTASAWAILAVSSLLPVFAADPLQPLFGNLELSFVRLSSIAFFCALTGFLTPMLVNTWSAGDPERAGTAYAVNVVGSILGPLIAGFWLLPQFGERGASGCLALLLFILAAAAIFRRTPQTKTRFLADPRLKFALAVVAAIVLFRASRDYETIFPTREVKRDYTATVIATGTGFQRKLFVNGVGMTFLTPITKYIADLPLAFLSRPPQNGLVICFGMGTTFRSMLTWGIPTTAVDLVPSVPKMFGYFHSDAANVLASPFAHVVVDDGRRFLDGSNQMYDVIVVDPPPPPAAAGSSLLYSEEFYSVVKAHLRQGGIFQTWYPNDQDPATTVAITKALVNSFPYVRAFESFDRYGIHFLASMQPIPETSAATLAGRMPPAAARDFVEWGPQTDPQRQFQEVLSHEIPIGKLIAKSPLTPSLRDDRPVNEYYFLRKMFGISR